MQPAVRESIERKIVERGRLAGRVPRSSTEASGGSPVRVLLVRQLSPRHGLISCRGRKPHGSLMVADRHSMPGDYRYPFV